MKQLKTIILIILLIVIIVALGIYMSDWDLTNQNLIPWFNGFLALIVILLIGTFPKKNWQKTLVIVGLFAVTAVIGFSLIFFSYFKCDDKISTTWEIGEYKISYGYAECWAGSAQEAKYNLDKRKLGGILNKRIDTVWKSETENLVTNKTFIDNKNCVIKCLDGKYKFDLCSEKSLPNP
ncbi:hypothetical protein [Maribacter sp. LLG6340-A2]|uniref:hypothetical protein n=1 Tax=Maribacter sp. LLG6340-A2 TaxID=3160834 RepID=UPI003867BF2B